MEDRLKKGRITALIKIEKNSSLNNAFEVKVQSTSASQRDLPVLQGILQNTINGEINDEGKPDNKQLCDCCYGTGAGEAL